eukprot:6212329-Pleurochrysis_carterae.AAC.1
MAARYIEAGDSMLAAHESHTFEVPTCMPEECGTASRHLNSPTPLPGRQAHSLREKPAILGERRPG